MREPRRCGCTWRLRTDEALPRSRRRVSHIPGRVDGRSRLERGEMGHELDRCFALLAREGEKASEEFVIRETRRESEDVRVHAVYVSRSFLEAPRRPRSHEEPRMSTRWRARAGRRENRVIGGIRGPRVIWGSGRQRTVAAPSKMRVRKFGRRKIMRVGGAKMTADPARASIGLTESIASGRYRPHAPDGFQSEGMPLC